MNKKKQEQKIPYDAFANSRKKEKCWGCNQMKTVSNFLGLCKDCEVILQYETKKRNHREREK